MTVNSPAPPSVNLSASTTNICAGQTVSFTATPINGGSSPSYQWQVNGSNVWINWPTYGTGILSNGDQVRVIMTSSSNCVTTPVATSNVITISVTPMNTPVMTISGNTTVAAGQGTNISSTNVYGGTAPTYTWQDSTSTHTWSWISGTSSSVIYYPANTGVKLRGILYSNAQCVTPTSVLSNTLTFTVNVVTAINPDPASRLGIKFYPNPVKDIFIIDSLKRSDKWESLEIISINGTHSLITRKIQNLEKVELDVRKLAAGYYMAVLRRKNLQAAYISFIKLY
jgi:hypothetical protein